MRRSYALALGAALLAAPLPACGQSDVQTAAPTWDPDYDAPRNVFDQPDISGNWTNVSLTPFMRQGSYGDRLAFTEEEVAELEGNADIEELEADRPTDPSAPAEFRHETTVTRPEFQAAGGAVGGYNRFWLDPGSRVMRVNGEPRTSILTTENGRIPPRIEGAPSGGGGFGGLGGSLDSYETRSLGERCIISFGRNAGPPMLANGFYNNNYQIVQGKDHVMILVEMIHDARIVRLDAEHRTDDVRPWFGDSIGWWEDDTLVVETTHIPERESLAGSWENLTVTERFTRVSDDRLHYQFTIEDPTIWAEPWGGEYEFSPLDGGVYEYACHEGNYALPGILRGARLDEDPAESEEGGESEG